MDNKHSTKVLAILFTGVLMGALDISIVGPAIPSIENSFNIAPRLLGWIFSIYVLFNLLGVSLFARLSDIFGRRIIYILSLTIFAGGSIVVAASGSFSVLLLGRGIQGFGASGIFPVASAVVGDIFPKEKRGRTLGLIGMVFGLAFIIGPILAGVLLRYFTWYVLFLINIPVALALIIASLKYIPKTRISTVGAFDWKGILFLGITLGTFAYGINSLQPDKFPGSLLSIHVMPFLIVAVVSFALTLLIERRAEAPIIKLTYFRNKQIVIAAIIAVSTGLLQASFVFIPDFAVGAFDVLPSTASFMLIPLVLATAIGSPIFGRLIDAIGSKVVVIFGLVLAELGFFGLGLVDTSVTLFYGAGVLIGLGLSVLSGSSIRYIMLNETALVDRAATQGMLNIFISVGQLSGAAIIGVFIADQAYSASYQSVFFRQAILLTVIAALSFALKNRINEKKDDD